jgi:hypothetical protein
MKSLLRAMAGIVALGGASAAELPTLRHARDAPQKSCTIDGMKGFVIPGTETCVRISGYVSGEVGAALRH